MKNKMIILLLMAAVAASCNKYLDKKNNTQLIVPNSLSDLQAILDNADQMNNSLTPSLGETSADDYFLERTIYNGLILGYQENYTWRYYFFPTENDWSFGYKPVYNANLALDLLKNIGRDAQNTTAWDNVKGSALFYRSYNFLNLLWNYAKAYDSASAGKDWGIALRLTSDFNVPTTRATNKECYEQVISDTKDCIPLLPDYPQAVTRPSKGAAYGLLARCYLSMRDYNDALLYADSCLKLNNQLMDLNGDGDIPAGISASYPFKQFNKETIFYSEMDGFPSFYYSSKSRVDTILYSLYADNDLRKSAYFKRNADTYQQFKGSYSASLACFSGIATDEMYLISAECYVRAGQVEKGLADLNALLSKRYKSGMFDPVGSISQTEALDTILNERRKELTKRGLRWMDLKRQNKEGANIVLKRVEDDGTYTLLPNTNFYALPIPEDIIKLTGMPQNDIE